ncbi:helix-turn-helix domain-containing protein [Brevibacillus panacihumi]|uniref:Helix-turn-helix domain-containing protein n=1 Tax=Brevibacillus panacihumi TaxID=497735 RepID=A0A3M8C4Y1_9BACL|nr:helix-turn-helix domain-containing protein [Brevibacillus panacihumi]
MGRPSNSSRTRLPARVQRGWTQSQAAERLGISSQVVSNYERDYRSPDKETLTRIAKVYNCSVDWLLGVTDNPERIDSPSSSDKKDDKEARMGLAFITGGEDLTEEEAEYLKESLELFRRMKERRAKEREK